MCRRSSQSSFSFSSLLPPHTHTHTHTPHTPHKTCICYTSDTHHTICTHHTHTHHSHTSYTSTPLTCITHTHTHTCPHAAFLVPWWTASPLLAFRPFICSFPSQEFSPPSPCLLVVNSSFWPQLRCHFSLSPPKVQFSVTQGSVYTVLSDPVHGLISPALDWLDVLSTTSAPLESWQWGRRVTSCWRMKQRMKDCCSGYIVYHLWLHEYFSFQF